MRSTPFVLVALLLGSLPLPALAEDPPSLGESTVRVLMVGDSWAEFMWVAESLRATFAANGRPDLLEEGGTTAISGTTAAQWTQPEYLARITDALDAYPEVDVVQLTLGGNDFLAGQPGGGWHTGMSAQDFATLQDQILADLNTVIDHVQSLRPGIEILLSHYDYTNFVDASLPHCPGTWSDLGQPTALEVNTAATELQDRLDAFADGLAGVTAVRHLGWMQFAYGFPSEGIDPGDLVPPGDLSRPSPIASMFLGSDCFHLGGAGYDLLAQRLWDEFYDGHFNDTLFTDGFESGNTSAWAVP